LLDSLLQEINMMPMGRRRTRRARLQLAATSNSKDVGESLKRSSVREGNGENKSSENFEELVERLEEVFKNKEFSDVIVKCGSIKFECHKVFLASSSPVFKAMFNTQMKEKISNEVHIDDVKPDVMADLLQFIYTGKFSNFDKFAMDLFIAADKYQIESLKKLCERELVKSIGMENCFSLLIMGDTYSPAIKKSALSFVIKNKNRIELEDNLVEYPSLMMELLKEFIGKNKDGDNSEYDDSKELERRYYDGLYSEQEEREELYFERFYAQY